MLQIKFIKNDGSSYEIKNIFNLEFVGHFMVMCLDDMKTRVVRSLADLAGYELKDMPVVKQGKSKRANNTKKAVKKAKK